MGGLAQSKILSRIKAELRYSHIRMFIYLLIFIYMAFKCGVICLTSLPSLDWKLGQDPRFSELFPVRLDAL